MNLVSVVMPVHNAAEFLPATLAALKSQTHTNWELLAALDADCSDDSEKILRQWADPRLRIMRADRPGPAAARNAGLAAARGDWIAFLDADDLWMPTKLTWQLAARAPFVATAFRRMDQAGVRTGRILRPPVQITYRRLLGQNSLCCSSVMVSRSSLGEVRFRDVGCEDYRFWLDILRPGVVGRGLSEPLVHYRIVRNSRGSRKWNTARESWEILAEELGQSRAAAHWPGFLARAVLKHSRF